jgi:ribosomal protein S18 acetylase RimI-like enzyme
MAGDITIRPYAPADHRALVELKHRMSLDEHGHLPDGSAIRDLLDLGRDAAGSGVDWYLAEVARAGGAIFVAEQAGAVVGSILWHRMEASEAFRDEVRSMAMICGVVVAPAARGQGLARRLMQQVEASIRDAGIGVAMLQVTHDNTPALGLYRGGGYLPLELTLVKPL